MLDPWKAPDSKILPDFIIAGGMKCGTTTLHHILNRHPDIYIPEEEIHFFDMDDITEHPEFLYYNDGEWISPEINENYEKYWHWYNDFFLYSEDHQKIGEDSTGYLASRKAPKRIATQKKDIKIIILLRDPVYRTYSHYWHNVRAGRVCHSFENTLRYYPNTIIKRSLYKQQIQKFYDHIPQNLIKIIIFEEFVQDKRNVIKDLLKFLNLDTNKLEPRHFNIHSNKGKAPLSIKIQLFHNKINREHGNWLYREHFPDYKSKVDRRNFFRRVIKNTHKILNPPIRKQIPAINKRTYDFLSEYFKKELIGLDKMINKDINRYWFQDSQLWVRTK
jgi:hypothetical protein